MESMQIVSGFSDLKRQFLLRNNGVGLSFSELRLHFRAENDFLVMHDFKNHKASMALGRYIPQTKNWKIFAENPSLGRNLHIFITKNRNCTQALREIGQLYRSHGFIPL